MAAVIKLEKRVDFVTEYMSMEDLAGSIWISFIYWNY